jgi:hypothetical protein
MMRLSLLVLVICLALLISVAHSADKGKKAEPAKVQAIPVAPEPVKPENDQITTEGEVVTTYTRLAGEQIKWQVISSGGNIGGTSTNYGLSGTVAQTAVGGGTSTNYGLGHGFWQVMSSGPPPCDCFPGDANNDLTVNVGDAVYVISYVFKGGAPPQPYATCSGDANGDCACNVGDAVYIISYVFKGGAAPVDCETWVGTCGLPIVK